MKKSNKIISLAAIIVLASLTTYNFALRAEYKKGTYKDPFYNYQIYKFKQFNEVELEGGNVLEVEIVAGDKSDISIHNRLKDYVKVEQRGNKLFIGVKDSTERVYGFPKGIIVSTKRLKAVKVDAQSFTYNNHRGEKVTDNTRQGGVVTLKNFELDSLNIHLGTNSKLKLQKSKIRIFQGIVGSKFQKGSVLDVEEGNHIEIANFTVNNQSSLKLTNPSINKLNYTLADSAEVTLKGSSLSLIRK